MSETNGLIQPDVNNTVIPENTNITPENVQQPQTKTDNVNINELSHDDLKNNLLKMMENSSKEEILNYIIENTQETQNSVSTALDNIKKRKWSEDTKENERTQKQLKTILDNHHGFGSIYNKMISKIDEYDQMKTKINDFEQKIKMLTEENENYKKSFSIPETKNIKSGIIKYFIYRVHENTK